MARRDNRSPLARAKGLGAARSGVRAWWWQRVTALALVPLAVWFLAAMIAVAGRGHQALSTWLSQPSAAIPMVLLIVAMFWHMALGLTVVAEDYLHDRVMRIATVAVIQLACLAIAVAAVIAVAWLAAGVA